MVTVGSRLASRTTASSEVKEGSGLNLELFRDRGLDLRWSGAGISLGSDGFEARCRCLVLGLWSSTEEAEPALGAIVAARGIGCGFGRVGVGHERAACFSRDGGVCIVGCNNPALSFFDVVDSGICGGWGGVRGFES